MNLRDFQYVLRHHRPDLYADLRKCWEPIELRIRRRIPKRYRFGGVGKVVLELAEEKPSGPLPPYRELLGVGLYHCPDFQPYEFLAKSKTEQRREIIGLTRVAMSALADRFAADITWLIEELEQSEQEGAEQTGRTEPRDHPIVSSRKPLARGR